MPLTDTAVRNAKKREKPAKLSDERGLHLLVSSVGKYWRFDYRFAGKRKTLALGVYPDISLAIAQAATTSLPAPKPQPSDDQRHPHPPGRTDGTTPERARSRPATRICPMLGWAASTLQPAPGYEIDQRIAS
jgi:hypothetical protein